MLKFLNANKKNSLKKLEFILQERNKKQSIQSANVKKILSDVKKKAIKQLLVMKKNFLI